MRGHTLCVLREKRHLHKTTQDALNAALDAHEKHNTRHNDRPESKRLKKCREKAKVVERSMEKGIILLFDKTLECPVLDLSGLAERIKQKHLVAIALDCKAGPDFEGRIGFGQNMLPFVIVDVNTVTELPPVDRELVCAMQNPLQSEAMQALIDAYAGASDEEEDADPEFGAIQDDPEEEDADVDLEHEPEGGLDGGLDGGGSDDGTELESLSEDGEVDPMQRFIKNFVKKKQSKGGAAEKFGKVRAIFIVRDPDDPDTTIQIAKGSAGGHKRVFFTDKLFVNKHLPENLPPGAGNLQ